MLNDVHPAPGPIDPYGATSPPLYQTATFHQDDPGAVQYDYSRSGNPTRDSVERQLAELEGGTWAGTYASGMAALDAVVQLASSGDTIIVGRDGYGGTDRLLRTIAAQRGVRTVVVDTSNTHAVVDAFTPQTRLVLLESPTNPQLTICDIRAITAAARSRGIVTAVDNTLLTPLGMRPLELGADLVVHSATKALNGHGDVTAGVVVTRDDALAAQLAFHRNACGTALAPFPCWLLQRGLATLELRVERQQTTARALATWLAARDDLTDVRYPGLASHPHADRHRAQAHGDGSVIALRTGCVARSRALIAALQRVRTTVSFGSVTSSVNLPGAMSHASVPDAERAARDFPEDLVRLSVGLESAALLRADLDRALAAAPPARPAELMTAGVGE